MVKPLRPDVTSTLSAKYRGQAMTEIVTDVVDILDNELEDEIIQAAENGETGLDVDYELIQSCDSEIAQALAEDPDSIIPTFNEAITQFGEKNDITGCKEMSPRLTSAPTKKQIRNIRESHCGSLIEIDAIISKSTDVVPKLSTGAFRCERCEKHRVMAQPLWDEVDMPRQCPTEGCKQGKFGTGMSNLSPPQSETVDFQKLRVNEPHEQLKGSETPTSIDLGVCGQLTGIVEPGDKVTVVGVPRSRVRDDDSGMFDIYLEAQNIIVDNEEFEEIEPTEEEIKEIRTLSERPDVFSQLAESIAPGIKGWADQKEAVMYQLFGGVRKKTPNGSSKRGDVHVLLIGDPGLGKSEILGYANRISPRGVSSTGKGSSSAGLTAAAVKNGDFSNSDQWSLEAGTMVLADKGIAAIDELDKMSEEDRSSMHESMEQQTVTIAKAGINATLQSRCSVLGAANPKEGRFREFEMAISEQIDLNPALISRFDLIFTMIDDMSEEEDKEIAEHILDSNYVAQVNESEKMSVSELDESEAQPDVPPELFRKYIAFSRRNYNPVITDEAKLEIKDFYTELRHSADDPDVIPVTARKIEAIIRIAEASARIRLSNSITAEDAERAIETVKKSLIDVGYDEENDMFDADKIESSKSYSQYSRKRAIKNVIEDQTENKDRDGIEIEEVVSILSHEDEELIRAEIESMKSAGNIMFSNKSENKIRMV